VQLVTPENLGAVYTDLHELLKARGLRKQIGMMGGDLIEGLQDEESPFNHRAWFRYMSKNYADILDAYSVHIYWNYDAAHKFKHRLDDVQQVLKPLIKRPLYVTEYGVKGFDIKRPKNPNGVPAPGNFHVPNTDRTIPIGRTNVRFSRRVHRAAQMSTPASGLTTMDKGRSGCDRRARTKAGRCTRATTFFVCHDDDRTGGASRVDFDASHQCVAAFAGVRLGLDEAGQLQNGRSSKRATFLPPRKRLSPFWNKNGGGMIVFERR
jgi:hypothetical protein